MNMNLKKKYILIPIALVALIFACKQVIDEQQADRVGHGAPTYDNTHALTFEFGTVGDLADKNRAWQMGPIWVGPVHSGK